MSKSYIYTCGYCKIVFTPKHRPSYKNIPKFCSRQCAGKHKKFSDKKCRRCQTIKPVIEFKKNKTNIMKNDQTTENFINFCETIVNYNRSKNG